MKTTNLALVRKEDDAPKVTTTHARDGAIVIRVEAARVEAPDELVAFPFGLEASAASSLVRRGKLRAAKIGRRLYAKRSDVLALVDALAKEPRTTTTIDDGYAAFVARTKGGSR
jgi:hypothetical protein